VFGQCSDRYTDGYMGHYGDKEHTKKMKETIFFTVFMGLHPILFLRYMMVRSSMRGTVAPVSERKIFNCFYIYSAFKLDVVH
jgi:hypothetical protein